MTSQKQLIFVCMDTNYSIYVLLIPSTFNNIGNTGIFNCMIVYLQATFLTPPWGDFNGARTFNGTRTIFQMELKCPDSSRLAHFGKVAMFL